MTGRHPLMKSKARAVSMRHGNGFAYNIRKYGLSSIECVISLSSFSLLGICLYPTSASWLITCFASFVSFSSVAFSSSNVS